MMKSVPSIREQIALLSLLSPGRRLACVTELETETLVQLSEFRHRRSMGAGCFEGYADALAVAELEARLEFLRGLKFDLVSARAADSPLQPVSSLSDMPE